MAATLMLGLGAQATAGSPRWIEVKSPNFTVYSDAGAKEAGRIAFQFEQVRVVFQTLWPEARTRSLIPIVILAPRDEGGLKALLPEYWQRNGAMHPAGYSASGSDKYYLALRADADDRIVAGQNPYYLLYKVYLHVLFELNLGTLPPWLGRGLAEFFGMTLVEGDHIAVGRPPSWQIDILRERRMLPLTQLFGLSSDAFKGLDHRTSALFDAQSWALVHMLYTDPGGQGPRQINTLLGLLRRGADERQAVREALGDPAALDKQLQAYVRRYAFHYGTLKADTRLKAADFPVREVGPAELLALQGDFQAHRGEYAAAKLLLDQAAQQDPKLALVHAARGYLAWREQGLEAALPHYQRAVELDSGDFFTQSMLGTGLVRQNTPDAMARAEAALSQAVELNNEYAPAYERLASVIVQRGGDLDRALGLARRAVALQPAESELRLTVVWILQRAGRNDEALQEAQAALRVARDDRSREHVQKRLDELARAKSAQVGVSATPGAATTAGGADAAQGLAAARQGCEGGSAESCTTLAALLLGGAAGPPDPAAAARAFGQARDSGALPACTQAGLMLAFMREVPHDETAAAPYLRKGCDGGEGRACSGLGVLHMNGKGVPRDLARTVPLLERGCAADDVMGCLNLATLLEAGAGVKKDVARARELYANACEKGVQFACAKAQPAAK